MEATGIKRRRDKNVELRDIPQRRPHPAPGYVVRSRLARPASAAAITAYDRLGIIRAWAIKLPLVLGA